MDENEFLAGHFRDLASRSYQNNIFTFTNFLGEAEQALLVSMSFELSYAGFQCFGGTDYAERKIARFGKPADLGYEQDFPIACLKITQRAGRFSEVLSHRDYLGTLMHLGIERELLGDIVVKETLAYVFCLDRIAEYIMENLHQIRRDSVQISLLKEIPEELHPVFREEQVVVSSQRLDAVIARLYNLSRSQSQDLFRTGKVFINGKECTNSSAACKEGDHISVRGYGKCLFCGVNGVTGKGRIRVLLKIYV